MKNNLKLEGDFMAYEAVFKVETKLEATDYRKFLYISMFKKNKLAIPIVLGISLIFGVMSSHNYEGRFVASSILLHFILVFGITMGVLLLKVERIKNKRIKTDKTGFFDAVTVLEFYKDRLKISAPYIEASNKMEYSKFYQVLESRNYFMFYINSSMAHILRKEDLKGIDMNTFRNFLQEKFEGNFKRI